MERVTDWATVPLVLDVAWMSRLTGKAKSTIWKKCQADRKARRAGSSVRTMKPEPIDLEAHHPEWNRDDVMAYYQRRPITATTGTRRKPFENITELKLAKQQLARESMAS
jgi:hypothetical protein